MAGSRARVMAAAGDRQWQRRIVVAVLAAWAALALAQTTRLVAPPEPPPGQALASFFPLARGEIPAGATYLYVLPHWVGPDPGLNPRLRYELFPRHYTNAPLEADESSVRAQVARDGVAFIVVPDARAYPPDHWVRQDRPWFRRIPLDQDNYVLAVTTS